MQRTFLSIYNVNCYIHRTFFFAVNSYRKMTKNDSNRNDNCDHEVTVKPVVILRIADADRI